MTSVTATAARKDIYNLIARVNEDCKPVAITTSKGKGPFLWGRMIGRLSRRRCISWACPAWRSSSLPAMRVWTIAFLPMSWTGEHVFGQVH